MRISNRQKNITFCSKSSDRSSKGEYYPLRKSFERLTKVIGDQGKKQVETLKFLNYTNQQLKIKDALSIKCRS